MNPIHFNPLITENLNSCLNLVYTVQLPAAHSGHVLYEYISYVVKTISNGYLLPCSEIRELHGLTNYVNLHNSHN